MPAVYVHLPFCPYICPYCDFAKWPHRRSAAERYMRALECEIDSEARCEAATVFLGGGTPNAYSREVVAAVLARVHERFPGAPGRETTIELNPELVQPGDMGVYRDAGITRVSIGVQSFAPDEIRTLGRRHSAADVERVVRLARESGIGDVSVDLIFGVPGQTAASWRRSLEKTIALSVNHVSTYGLTIEPDTPYASWQAREPRAFLDDAAEAELYDIAISTLETAGFEQYEISNFALPGHRCSHNENYWANGEYIGLGVGAASYRGVKRSVHTRDLETYVRAALAGEGIPSESESLAGPRRAGEAVMLGLRTAQGVCLAAFKERYGLDFLTFYSAAVERYRSQGLLAVDGERARLTRRGRFFANDVCAAFITLE